MSSPSKSTSEPPIASANGPAVKAPAAPTRQREQELSFADLPHEVRKMVYDHIREDLDEDSSLVFDLKKQYTIVHGRRRHRYAGAISVNQEMRQELRLDYLYQFAAIVQLGGPDDYVEYDFSGNHDLRYLFKSGVTHVADFTADYETGYGREGRGFAAGQIQVYIAAGQVVVTGSRYWGAGEADHDDKEWDLIATIKEGVEEFMATQDIELIDCHTMEWVRDRLVEDIETWVMDQMQGDDGEDDESSPVGTEDYEEVEDAEDKDSDEEMEMDDDAGIIDADSQADNEE